MQKLTLNVLVIILMAALAACSTEPPPPAEPTAPAAPAAPAAAVGGEVTGRIMGTAVSLGEAEFDGELAIFKEEGWGFSPSLLVFLFLDDDGPPEGRTFVVTADSELGGGTPHVHLRWRDPESGDIEVDSVMSGYHMTLTFGTVADGTLPGSIELEIPGRETAVSGSFLATLE